MYVATAKHTRITAYAILPASEVLLESTLYTYAYHLDKPAPYYYTHYQCRKRYVNIQWHVATVLYHTIYDSGTENEPYQYGEVYEEYVHTALFTKELYLHTMVLAHNHCSEKWGDEYHYKRNAICTYERFQCCKAETHKGRGKHQI